MTTETLTRSEAHRKLLTLGMPVEQVIHVLDYPNDLLDPMRPALTVAASEKAVAIVAAYQRHCDNKATTDPLAALPAEERQRILAVTAARTWDKITANRWRSSDGYEVWIQSRPRHEALCYGAKPADVEAASGARINLAAPSAWLGVNFSFSEAKAACSEHAIHREVADWHAAHPAPETLGAAKAIPGLVCTECDKPILRGDVYAGRTGDATHRLCMSAERIANDQTFKIAGDPPDCCPRHRTNAPRGGSCGSLAYTGPDATPETLTREEAEERLRAAGYSSEDARALINPATARRWLARGPDVLATPILRAYVRGLRANEDIVECSQRLSEVADRAYDSIRAERAAQIAKGRTPEKDDARTEGDWRACLDRVLAKDYGKADRRRWTKIGSVAVAAIQSIDRRALTPAEEAEIVATPMTPVGVAARPAPAADATEEARAQIVESTLRLCGVGLLVTHPSDGPPALQAVVRAVDASRTGPQLDREALGRIVREVWIAWAYEQAAPKPSWLVPWEGLSECDREVDRRIGERIAREALASDHAIAQRIRSIPLHVHDFLAAELARILAHVATLPAWCAPTPPEGMRFAALGGECAACHAPPGYHEGACVRRQARGLTEEQASAWHPFTPGMASEVLCAFCGKTAAEHVGPTIAAMSAVLSGLGWVQDDVGLWAEEGNGCHLWGTHDAFRSATRKIESQRASRGETGPARPGLARGLTEEQVRGIVRRILANERGTWEDMFTRGLLKEGLCRVSSDEPVQEKQ